MRLVGLTGGYASGKSLVASVIERLGGRVIDLDRVSRALCAPGGAALPTVRQLFGDGIIAADGGLDRRALAAIVFGDEAKRRTLEAALHPVMRKEAMRRADSIVADDPDAVVVIDGALLFEGGWYKEMRGTILVTCSTDARIRRGRARDHLTEDEARQRLLAQWDDEQKRPLADYLIDNSGDPKETIRQVEKLWPVIVASVA